MIGMKTIIEDDCCVSSDTPSGNESGEKLPKDVCTESVLTSPARCVIEWPDQAEITITLWC